MAVIVAVTAVLAFVASLFMAWTIGAGSSGSTPFAPAVGANAISTMRAGFLVGILGFVGAVLQGGNVTETIGGGLIRHATLSPLAVSVGLFIAALFVAFGIFTGYPIATAFTVTGAVTGVGLALGGELALGTYTQIVTLWVLIPFFGGGIAFVTARTLSGERVPTHLTMAVLVLLTSLVVFNMEFTVLGPAGESRSVAHLFSVVVTGDGRSSTAVYSLSVGLASLGAVVLRRKHLRTPIRTERLFLLVLGGLVAFSAGATQVGLAVGPLLPLAADWQLPTIWILLFGGVGLLVGSWTGAPRMIKTLSQDYSALGPKRSIAALVPAFVIAQVAVFLGVPVSFNEIIVSTIVGSGAASSGQPVSLSKMRNTVVAWVGCLGLSSMCSYVAMVVLL